MAKTWWCGTRNQKFSFSIKPGVSPHILFLRRLKISNDNVCKHQPTNNGQYSRAASNESVGEQYTWRKTVLMQPPLKCEYHWSKWPPTASKGAPNPKQIYVFSSAIKYPPARSPTKLGSFSGFISMISDLSFLLTLQLTGAIFDPIR